MFATVLTEAQIERLHAASLCILKRVGVLVPHPEMLCRLESAGARVDHAGQRAYLGEELVMGALGQAGRQFTLYGRDLANTARFGQGQRNYNTSAGQAMWVDRIGGPRRYASLDDVAAATRAANSLDSINLVGAMADPQEVPVRVRCLEVLATQLRNTTKPMHFWFHDRPSARFAVEMLIALRGDAERAAAYPLCYPLLEPISPLRFPHHGIDLLFETSRLGLPVAVGPMAQMGLSAPATVAGTMAQENAEVLAGICLVQLVRPGVPVCYGGICHAFDMRTTQLIFAGPEQAIFSVAMTQMGRHYGLPVYANAGLTDAKCPDAQAGLEAGITLVLAAAAGADVFGHMGICGVDQAASLDLLMLQDEIIRYVESTLRELDFSDDALGLDVLEALGPGGTLIDTPHTAAHFRKELWMPGLLDRRFFQAWQDAGAQDTAERCRLRKEQCLLAAPPEPLPADLAATLDEIVAAARRELL